jgi:glycerol uptake facilitator protein
LPFSSAHLNPAVTFGFLVINKIKRSEVLPYLTGQFAGALLAAMVLYFLFIGQVEVLDVNSAMMFGEFYPNPGNANLPEISTFSAFSLECFGTFGLMFGILKITKMKFDKAKLIHPLLIGLLLAILIFCIAPYTQAGFNPARDFAPRLVSYLAGWDMAFSYNGLGWLTVYVLGPILGAVMASSFNRKSTLKKMMPVSKA